jgi:hypothetical protein
MRILSIIAIMAKLAELGDSGKIVLTRLLSQADKIASTSIAIEMERAGPVWETGHVWR